MSSYRKKLREKYQKIAREIPDNFKMPASNEEPKRIIPIHQNGIVELRVVNEQWISPDSQIFSKRVYLIASKQLKCHACEKPIANDQIVHLLQPSLLINCLDCSKHGNLWPVLLPKFENWRQAILCTVKYEKGGR